MTDKRNKSLPCLMVMAAVLLSAFTAGGPQAMDYWTANAERSGVVHAGNGREAAVLCMQGRKVVMQVQVDRAAGFSYKARSLFPREICYFGHHLGVSKLSQLCTDLHRFRHPLSTYFAQWAGRAEGLGRMANLLR